MDKNIMLGVFSLTFTLLKLKIMRNHYVAIFFITISFMALAIANVSMAQIKWDKSPDNPVFSPDVDGSWDDYLVNDPCVILKDGE
jgi:hypothetical protein